MLSNMAQDDCPHCGGTGWKLVAAEGAHASATSNDGTTPDQRPGSQTKSAPVVAVRCDCQEGDRVARILEKARIPQRYEHCNFDNFEIDIGDQEAEAAAWNSSLRSAKLIVEAFAREYPVSTKDGGLLLMGKSGTGKTHLAVAALKQLVLRGHQGVFYDYNDLLKQIQASYNPENQSREMEVLEPVLHAELLLLDDLGASKPSAWALETVGHILNVRYNEDRITLITTNYPEPPTDFAQSAPPTSRDRRPGTMYEETLEERIGYRVRSRLFEMCRTVELRARDYRKHARRAWLV